MFNVVGTIKNPLTKWGTVNSQMGIVLFFTNVIRLVFVAAGIYALVNFIIAGYQYMSAGGDSKQLTAAWARIWQTLLGLIIIVSSFALAGIIGFLFFGDATYILKPVIYGP
jgi:hydrogenase-4 membrane subunit HyfE